MLLLLREDIEKVFAMREAIEAVKRAFMLFSEGKCNVPLRTNIQAPGHNGTFLFMPSYMEEINCASLKIINIFPDNIKSGKNAMPSQVILIDGKTGFIQSVMDGTYITKLRTGAASGAAFDTFAVDDAKIGAIIGTGGLAKEQIAAMLTARKLKEVKVYSRNRNKLKEFVLKMNNELESYGALITMANSSDEAVCDADMIVCATPSLTPVFDGRRIKAGATVSCVGSYQPNMQETDSVLLSRADKIYFDSEEAVLSESGDILIPIEKGIISSDDFTGDIGDVLLKKIPARERTDEIIFFKSVGIGAQDLVTAKAVYDRAVAEGIGTRWGD